MAEEHVQRRLTATLAGDVAGYLTQIPQIAICQPRRLRGHMQDPDMDQDRFQQPKVLASSARGRGYLGNLGQHLAASEGAIGPFAW